MIEVEDEVRRQNLLNLLLANDGRLPDPCEDCIVRMIRNVWRVRSLPEDERQPLLDSMRLHLACSSDVEMWVDDFGAFIVRIGTRANVFAPRLGLDEVLWFFSEDTARSRE